MEVRRLWTILGVFILFLLIASGCAVNKETMNAFNEAKETFQKATLIGAKKCAPCQYATAEAYIAIADHEIKDYWREIEHLDKHIKIVKEKSLEAIRICEKPPSPPAPPTVAPLPPTPPKVVAPTPAPPKEEFPPPTPPTIPPLVGPPTMPAPEAPPAEVVAPTPAPPKEEFPPPTPPTIPPLVGPPTMPAPEAPPAPAPKPPREPVFEPIYFDINKSNISPAASKTLDKNGMILKDNPHIKVIIEGHADSTGSEKFNQILSEKRAESAKRYLIDKFNIPDDRMKTKGYGSKRPIADNATKEGRTKNRRVEFRIIP